MWVLGLVIMIDQADQNIVRGVATPIQHAFHLSDLQVGVLLSCFIVVNVVVSVPAGYLADRWHRTRTVGHTVVIWSAITSLTAAAWSYPALIAIRSALGFGQAVTEPAASSSASTTARRAKTRRPGRSRRVCWCSSGTWAVVSSPTWGRSPAYRRCGTPWSACPPCCSP